MGHVTTALTHALQISLNNPTAWHAARGKHDATLPAGTIQRHKFDTTYGGIKKFGRSLAETLLLISFTEQRSVVISCCFKINQQKTAINC